MNSTLVWIQAGAAGAGLGMFFYSGLWWTVRRGVTARQPALWLLGSLLVRISLVTAGFYLVGNGHWQRLVPCLAGFILARVLVLMATARWEARHAP